MYTIFLSEVINYDFESAWKKKSYKEILYNRGNIANIL